MEYYLVVTEELTGVIVTIHGFTLDSEVAYLRCDKFDEEHDGCDGHSYEDHECATHNQRIVVHPIYKMEE